MRRLILQAEVVHNPPTRWLFQQAGLSAGMRVLDVGCGAGDVTFLAAEFVGPHGTVVGIDSSPRALDTARLRANRAGLQNVVFTQADLYDYASPEPFDALVGRSVLMYLQDPVAALRNLLRSVRGGGRVAFREVLVGEPFVEAWPRNELVDQFNDWYMAAMPAAMEAVGVHGQVGVRLHQVFSDVGLLEQQMWIHATIGSDYDWPGWEYLDHQVQLWLSHPKLRSVIARVGPEPPVALDLTMIAARIRDQVLQQGGVLRLQRAVQASARKPES